MALRRESPFGIGLEARLVLAAFAGVGRRADAVHGDGQGLVRFLADGAEGHGAGGEALDDLAGRLDLLERDRRAGLLEAPAGRAACTAAGSGR